MNKLLISGMVLTGVLIGWGCEKAPAPATPEAPKATEVPKTPEAPKVETPAPAAEAPRPAEVVKAPVLPHIITDAEVGQKAICPVMGTAITVDKNTLSAEYKGKVYYFCCGGCPEEFKANPDKFAK